MDVAQRLQGSLKGLLLGLAAMLLFLVPAYGEDKCDEKIDIESIGARLLFA